MFHTKHGNSNKFSSGKGVRQGCILPPDRFNIFGERTMRKALGTSYVNGLSVNNLNYADDIALATTKKKCTDSRRRIKRGNETAT